MHVEDSQLKAFILDAGLIAKEKLKEAEKKAKETKEQLARFLVKEKLITQEQLIRLEAYILGIPFVNLEKETIPDEILQIIPEPIARRHSIIAFRKKGKELEVAMLNPEDIQTIEFIKKKSDLKILPRLTNPISIKNALAQYQKTLEAEFGDLIKKESEIAILPEKGKEESHKDLKEAAEQMPIIKIVETLLKHAIL